jgi:hypothetical protein
MDPTDTPANTASAEPSEESTPAATDAPAKGGLPGAKFTTGDAKSAFNAFVRAVATGDGATVCGFMPFDAEFAAMMPEGFDCKTLFDMTALSDDDRKLFGALKITNIRTTDDGKSCVDAKDVKVGGRSITEVFPDEEGGDEPLCIEKVDGHWVFAAQ